MRRFKRLGLIAIILMFIVPILAIAQDPEAIDIGEVIGKAQIVFVSGIGGLSVMALTELIKRLLKLTGVLSFVASVVVSIVASLFYLLSTAQFTILNLLIYSALVACVANGIFKFPKRTT